IEQGLDISAKLRRFLLAFLRERTFRVRVGRAQSSLRPVLAGVSEGSVVSPFLFNPGPGPPARGTTS
ncbi:hypothetical protein MTO96_045123, partial [Rhipicephalus appendiculatus]